MARKPSTIGCLSEFPSGARTVKKLISILSAIFKMINYRLILTLVTQDIVELKQINFTLR